MGVAGVRRRRRRVAPITMVPMCKEDTSGLESRERIASLLREVEVARCNIRMGPILSFSRENRRGGGATCFMCKSRNRKARPRDFCPSIRVFVKRNNSFLVPRIIERRGGNIPTKARVRKGRTINNVHFTSEILEPRRATMCIIATKVSREGRLPRRATQFCEARGRITERFRRMGGR